MRSIILCALATISACAVVCPDAAMADDGGISFGGSPHLLSGHASVAMRSEVVHINVGDKTIKVDCHFVFHNSGPAATVRMGFPDEGQGAAEPYQGDPLPPASKLHATFTSYESYVDGKKVPTKTIAGADREHFWHVKTVTFKAKSDCHIRDVYSLPPGGQVTSDNGLYQQTKYILHTGSSWHGPIGKAELVVNFAPDTVHPPIKLTPISALPGQDLYKVKWTAEPAGLIIYQGPCIPTIDGLSLHFTKSNFRPTENDDILLYYAYRKLTNMPPQ